MKLKRIAGALLCVLGLSMQLAAAAFPEPYDSEPAEGAPMSPKDLAASFSVPDGVTTTVFAAEPQLRNPIAMTWDGRGRAWVAENYTYAERKKRFELGLRDRVLIFEDLDWDGVADKRTVFTDSVQMLTGIEHARGGVWLMCPPQLLFVPDANGDDVPDGPAQVMLDGFTVAKNNYHNFANGLKWGPDGWLYGRCGHSCPGKLGLPGTPDADRVPMDGGIWRFHPKRKVVEVLTHGTTNPWGHDWDRHGELFFINTVIGHLWHMIPGAHFKESFGQSLNPLVYDRIGQHADHFHFDRNAGWTKSRHGKANSLGGGHCHVGMTIYQDTQFPEAYRNRLFTWNTHGRRANVERLQRHGSGYVASHEPDVFLAKDTWFRGVEINTGPDGSLFGLDWTDAGECHEHSGVHRSSGRMLRFSYGNAQKPDLSKLMDADRAGIARALTEPSVWYYRQFAKYFPEQPSPEVIAYLRSRFAESADSVERLRAMWLLYRVGALDDSRLLALLKDKDEHVRTWAVRLLTDQWTLDTLMGPRPIKVLGDAELVASRRRSEIANALSRLAHDESSGLVRLALASTLQRMSLRDRTSLATVLASRAEDADDHNLPAMVWYGMMPLFEEPTKSTDLLLLTEWPDLLRWQARAQANHPERLETVLSAAADPKRALPILQGISQAFRGRQQVKKPVVWPLVVEACAERVDCEQLVRELSVLFGDGRALDELKALVDDRGADAKARSAALETLIAKKPKDLRAICMRHLHSRPINLIAIRGLTQFDDPKLGVMLADKYRRFWKVSEKTAVIDALCTRPDWATTLLDRVRDGKVPRSAITPYHARQIDGLGDPALKQKLQEEWGSVRGSDATKTAYAKALRKELTPEVLAKANLVAGRAVYESVCAACHQLYGQGGKLGPDLTGSGRASLDYLLENVVDPSAVVSAEYRMSMFTLKDGRTLSGVVATQNDQSLMLRMLNEEEVVPKHAVVNRKDATQSIMPEGLLKALSKDQRRDLIGYLMHPQQVEK